MSIGCPATASSWFGIDVRLAEGCQVLAEIHVIQVEHERCVLAVLIVLILWWQLSVEEKQQVVLGVQRLG